MDYYGALNVTKEANSTEIKSKYRRLALQYHPAGHCTICFLSCFKPVTCCQNPPNRSYPTS